MKRDIIKKEALKSLFEGLYVVSLIVFAIGLYDQVFVKQMFIPASAVVMGVALVAALTFLTLKDKTVATT